MASRGMPQAGALELIIGPMFSGKSTELLRRVRRHAFARRSTLVVKYSKDTRYTTEDCVATHDRVMMPSVSVAALEELGDSWKTVDVIAIDEGQFMHDLKSFCIAACAAGKLVLVAALDGTFAQEPFGDVCALIPKAESVVKLCAVCAVCGRDAAFTRRLTDSVEVEVVGGAEMYLPSCRSCFTLPLPDVKAAISSLPSAKVQAPSSPLPSPGDSTPSGNPASITPSKPASDACSTEDGVKPTKLTFDQHHLQGEV